jgi:hypothetical protein
VQIGVTLSIDLIFDLTAKIDMSCGFQVYLPDGANLVINPFDGQVQKANL